MQKRTRNILRLLVAVGTAFLLLAGLLFFLSQRYGAAWIPVAAISFLTASYHLLMRLAVGEAVTLRYRGRELPLSRFDFRLFRFEERFYATRRLEVLKKYALTAKPEQFDFRANTPEAVLHNVLQAELVHRLSFFLSYLPLLLIIPFCAPAAFVTTSVLGSLIDLYYVVLQRYNRRAVLRHIELSKRAASRRLRGTDTQQ